MPEVVPTAAPAEAPGSAPAAPARSSQQEILAAATRAFAGEPEPTAAEPAPAPPPLPSTPDAPATAAVLAEQESASALIRQRNELADARKLLDAERAKWKQEQAEHTQRVSAMERAYAEFERDQAAWAKARGSKRPLAEIARDLYLEDAKIEELPPEQQAPLRMQREMLRQQRELEQIRAEVKRAQIEQGLAQYRAQLAAGLSGITEETPLIKELATKNPQRLMAWMEQVQGDLAAKAPEAGILTAAQLAARLEPTLAAELEPYAGYWERKFKPVPPPAPQVASQAGTGAGASPTGPGGPPPPPPPASAQSVAASTPARLKPMTPAERIAAATRELEGLG